MTEFAEKLRHRCRNPRCRSKLTTPVANPREAFCTKGCRSSFYRKRCVICEVGRAHVCRTDIECSSMRCCAGLQAKKALGRVSGWLEIKPLMIFACSR